MTITSKGGKVVTIPLAPRTARAIDLAIGERTSGPVFLAADGRRLDRHGAGRIVRKTARRAGVSRQPAADTWPKRPAPLKDAAQAHRVVETGHSGGKVILMQ